MNIMKKALFIDRDGTLIKEPADEQIDAFEKLAFVPGVMRNLAFIRQKLDYEFVMVSNQDGLGTEAFPEDTFWPVHNLMMRTLEGEGVTFDDVLIDRSFPEENLPTRKPGTAMLGRYTSGDYDMEACWVIGDRETDAQLALNLGCRALILKEKDEDSFTDERIRYVNSWDRIAEILFAGERKVRVRRTTKETDIEVRLDLDGSGRCDIRTGLGFFDHMLEQIGKHGGMDLYIRTAEPVASKTIAQMPDMDFSSATIRNELADLVELGYLSNSSDAQKLRDDQRGFAWGIYNGLLSYFGFPPILQRE